MILITQDQKDSPYDLQHIRCIEYKFTPREMGSIEQQFMKSLQWMLKEHERLAALVMYKRVPIQSNSATVTWSRHNTLLTGQNVFAEKAI